MTPHKHLNNLPHFPACDWCRGCVVGLCMALAGCVSAPKVQEPLNLSQAKAAVIAYEDSGAYLRDLTAVADQAVLWLRERSARRLPGERLVMVLDIDETSLSNAPLMRRLDYAFIPGEWRTWVDSAKAPAIAPVRALFQEARRLGIEVMFVTGRKDPEDRAPTERNLKEQGFADYSRLILAQPGEKGLSTTERKTRARAALEAEGCVIIENVGDQESDLRGGHAERGFKLPNPFYLME